MEDNRENRCPFVKLAGKKNYQLWKYKVELLLECDDVLNMTTDPIPAAKDARWLAKNAKAKKIIGLLLEDTVIINIKHLQNAKDIWDTLKQKYAKASLMNKVLLLKKLCRMQLGSKSMEVHIADMLNVVDELQALGEEMKEQFVMALILGSLPEKYDTLITALEVRPEEELTISMVTEKLIQDYQRHEENSSAGDEQCAFKVKTSKSFKKKSNDKSSNDKSRIKCFGCGEFGHFRGDCKKIKQAKHVSWKQCLKSSKIKKSWYIDSGASNHMCNNKDSFNNLDRSYRDSVVVADGRCVQTEGLGDITISYRNEDSKLCQIHVNDVSLVPELDSNLLSVDKLNEDGYDILFKAKKCSVMKEGTQIFSVRSKNGLYEINPVDHLKFASSENKVKSDCVHMWHKRMGHRDSQAVKQMADQKLVDGIHVKNCSCDSKICDVCMGGKMTRKKYPKKSSSQTYGVLELIHTDLMGPIEESTPSGNRFVLTMIDDYSRYNTIYLLKNKSETASKIKEFVAMMENKFDKRVKRIRSDRGGEYIAQDLQTFLRQKGIFHEFSAPYCPQQNGIAERRNRYLMEMARCMLIQSNLPKRFWGEAICTANYTQNRLIMKSIGDKSPFELWTGRKPNVSYFRVFGCKAFVFVPKQLRRKLDRKCKELQFVGYCEETKGYRFLDIKSNKVVISRDAEFEENSEMTTSKCTEHCNNEVYVSLTSGGLPIEDYVAENDHDDRELSEDDEQVDVEAELAVGGARSDEGDGDSIEEFAECFEVQPIMPNVQQNIRRSERTRNPPDRYVSSKAALIQLEPRSYKDALKRKDFEYWKRGMQEEFDAIEENSTWELVEQPPNRKPIGCKWVYKLKLDADGKIQRYKARLVAKGFTQKFGQDYDEVFAPVVKQTVFRTLLAIASSRKMKVVHIDVKNAFLNGDLINEVYMRQPEGFVVKGKENHVYRLKRSLYGLKQSAKCWNDKINEAILGLGFRRGDADPCLYSKMEGEEWIYILLYVDDLLIASRDDKAVDATIEDLQGKFNISNLGEIKMYLGVQVEKDQNGVFYIHQKNYINKILGEYKMTDAKGSKIPMDPGYIKEIPGDDKKLPDDNEFRKIIGSLLYLTVNTRPDIAAAVSILGRKVSAPCQRDLVEAKRVLRFLSSTKDHFLRIGSFGEITSKLQVFVDADWAGDVKTRHSTSGFFFKYGDGCISWASRKQKNITLSSTEAEYVALSEACSEYRWMRMLFADFGIQIGSSIFFEDNQSCIALVNDLKINPRTKHIDVRYHHVRELHQKGDIDIKYCPTEEMIADILTKPLSHIKHQHFRKAMGLGVFSIEKGY